MPFLTANSDGLLGITAPSAPIIDTSSRGKTEAFNSNAPKKPGYQIPDHFEPFASLPRIALDIEGVDPDIKTKGPGAHRKDGKVVGVGIAYSSTRAIYYPLAHADTSRCIPSPGRFYDWLREEAQRFHGEITGANLIYDLDWLRTRHNVTFPHAKIRDVQIAEPLIDENRMTYKLGALSLDYLGEGKYTDGLSSLYGKDYISHMDLVDPGWAAEYCEKDCTLAWQILDKQMPIIHQQGLMQVFDVESRLMPLLLEMRHYGVRVNLEAAEIAYQRTLDEFRDSKAKIKELCGIAVEVWTAGSIAQAFKRLDLPYPTTAKGSPSFKKEWLAAHPHPLAKEIVRAREYDKIGGTFLKSYILDSHVDGRLFCQFNQLKSDDSGAVSGRFSSSNPNLQNIPARHPVLGPLCRSIFIPEEGMDWGCADWSQIEYRFLIHYAHITRGIDANDVVQMYLRDPSTDAHDAAAKMTGLERKHAKSINFGVVYGMGVATLAGHLGVSLQEAEVILHRFHDKAPFLKGMLDAASSRASMTGIIRTILGRRRRFEQWECDGKIFHNEQAAIEYYHRNPRCRRPRRAFTHKALNSLLQGSAADLMKLAMVNMWEDGLFNVLVPHLTVHDEMNVSIPRNPEGREAFKEMVHAMETTMKLEVPVLASSNTGANWDEAK